MSESLPTNSSQAGVGNGAGPAAAVSGRAEVRAQPWWQWLLVYPTLAVTLVTAVPTYFEKFKASRIGVAQQELARAIERNRLINKNIDCMLAPIDWVETANRTRVDATICYNTGDILVRMSWGKDNQFMDVVSNDGIRAAAEKEEKQRASSALISTANAAPGRIEGPFAAQEQVICQRWLAEGRLLQRIQSPEGCFDQIVNTYSGVVESRQPAPCSTQC